MLIAGKPQFNEEDNAIIYFRRLGYSKVKTRKLLRIDGRKMTKTQGMFGIFGKNKKGMHTQYKDLKTTITQLKRCLTDLGLHHEIGYDKLQHEVQETMNMIKYAIERKTR